MATALALGAHDTPCEPYSVLGFKPSWEKLRLDELRSLVAGWQAARAPNDEPTHQMENGRDMRLALPTEQTELDDGRPVAFRWAESRDAIDSARLGVPPFRVTGRDPAASESRDAVVIATFEGSPVGAAWLEFEDQQTAEGRLRLTVGSGTVKLGLKLASPGTSVLWLSRRDVHDSPP